MTEQTKRAIAVACAALKLEEPTPATLAMIEFAFVCFSSDPDVSQRVRFERHKRSSDQMRALK